MIKLHVTMKHKLLISRNPGIRKRKLFKSLISLIFYNVALFLLIVSHMQIKILIIKIITVCKRISLGSKVNKHSSKVTKKKFF